MPYLFLQQEKILGLANKTAKWSIFLKLSSPISILFRVCKSLETRYETVCIGIAGYIPRNVTRLVHYIFKASIRILSISTQSTILEQGDS
jgi:hypothetical protein